VKRHFFVSWHAAPRCAKTWRGDTKRRATGRPGPVNIRLVFFCSPIFVRLLRHPNSTYLRRRDKPCFRRLLTDIHRRQFYVCLCSAFCRRAGLLPDCAGAVSPLLFPILSHSTTVSPHCCDVRIHALRQCQMPLSVIYLSLTLPFMWIDADRGKERRLFAGCGVCVPATFFYLLRSIPHYLSLITHALVPPHVIFNVHRMPYSIHRDRDW